MNTRNEIARNHGTANAGPFIELVNGANGEISPPVFVGSTLAGAGGTALPGATIRVFRKVTSAPGELGSFLAQATADEAGTWEVEYPTPLPPGTVVAATQTRLIAGTATPEPPDGTSELAFATTTAEPRTPDGGGGASGAESVTSPPPIPGLPPRTSILNRPPHKSGARATKFQFTSNEPGSRFECELDRGRRRPCTSPQTYKRLRPGRHVFRVWAIDSSGEVDPNPAKAVFRVVVGPAG